MMDWILTKLDGLFRSGFGRLSRDVVNLPNAREHIERGIIMGPLCVIGSQSHIAMKTSFSGASIIHIMIWLCLVVAGVFEVELIVTELQQHSFDAWKRVVKFCFWTTDSLTPEEVAQRQNGGPLDGLADICWKAITGLPLVLALVVIVVRW